MRAALGRIPTLLIVAIVIALASCASMHGRPVIALPNGHYIERDRDARPCIVRRDGRRVVSGPIAAYAVWGTLVAGAVGAWAPSQGGYANAMPYVGGPETRYFILDTATGVLQMGLSAIEWRAQLQARGVPGSFAIFAPILGN